MACLLGFLALFVPRVTILIVAFFSDYIGESFRTNLWPLLGFFVMPLTTLAYSWAWHAGSGEVTGGHFAAVVVAALIDLGIIGGNAKKAADG